MFSQSQGFGEDDQKDRLQQAIDSGISNFQDLSKTQFVDQMMSSLQDAVNKPHSNELPLVKETGSFLNLYNGSGGVVTRCKHYSHLSCLNKYRL